MQISHDQTLHLTYCLNIHPGTSWRENLCSIRKYTLKIKEKIAPDTRFGLGLRLSNAASIELSAPEELNCFKKFLKRHELYVFTLNGFPYGDFHNNTIKEKVYKPDWTQKERESYTNRLGTILAALLPPDVNGSISTVPVMYKEDITNPSDIATACKRILNCGLELQRMYEETGKKICLGLEPEPDCYLETTPEVIAFFKKLRSFGITYLTEQKECSSEEARMIIQERIGVCLDTCHNGVEFEDPLDTVCQLEKKKITISKVQLSNALRMSPSPESLEYLKTFCNSPYLHQVKVKTDAGISSYPDLDNALHSKQKNFNPENEWRIHFHVPLFFQNNQYLHTTQETLGKPFFDKLKTGITEHLEIETYTFEVLPENIGKENVIENITAEFKWLLTRLSNEGTLL